MFQSRLIVSLAAVLAVAAFVPRAFASAPSPDPQRTGPPSPTYTMSQQNLDLDSIVVNGYNFNKLPFVVTLQIIKKALDRPWSSASADRDKLVCRYSELTGSHFDTMTCLTNGQRLNRYQRTQDAIWKAETEVTLPPGASPAEEGGCGYTCAFFNTGSLNVLYQQIAQFASNSKIDPGAMRALLAKLPPADASYTLRVVNDSGQPVLDYVIRNGDLVHVYHYIYENSTAVKTSGASTQR